MQLLLKNVILPRKEVVKGKSKKTVMEEHMCPVLLMFWARAENKSLGKALVVAMLIPQWTGRMITLSSNAKNRHHPAMIQTASIMQSKEIIAMELRNIQIYASQT